MTHQEIEERVEKAKALFKQGFNCSLKIEIIVFKFFILGGKKLNREREIKRV